VDEIYKFGESFMHDSGTRQDPDFIGKPDDLYPRRYSDWGMQKSINVFLSVQYHVRLRCRHQSF
jgi:hypothetical protein